jgi:hypothetical protein
MEGMKMKKGYLLLLSIIFIAFFVGKANAQIQDQTRINFSITGYFQFATGDADGDGDITGLTDATDGVYPHVLNTVTIDPLTDVGTSTTNNKTGLSDWYYRSNQTTAKTVTGVVTAISGTTSTWASKNLTCVFSGGSGLTFTQQNVHGAGDAGGSLGTFVSGLGATTVTDGVITFNFWYTDYLEPIGSWTVTITWTCN